MIDLQLLEGHLHLLVRAASAPWLTIRGWLNSDLMDWKVILQDIQI